MQLSERQARAAAKKPKLPDGVCLVASTSDYFAQFYGHLAKVVSSAETKYVVGVSRKDAVRKAIQYAERVLGLPSSAIRFLDGFAG